MSVAPPSNTTRPWDRCSMDVQKHFYTPAEKKLNERNRAETKSFEAYNEIVLVLWFSKEKVISKKMS